MDKEVWKEIEGWEGLYAISNFGRVKSLRTKGRGIVKPNHVLKQRANRDGYLYVNLAKNSKYKTVYVHRLVGKAFVKNEKGLTFLNHIDGEKSNNHYSNLEWVTPQENIMHARKTGLNTYKPDKRGEESPKAKITNVDAQKIRFLYSTGKFSQYDLSKRYGISQTSIWRIINKKTFKHV